MKGLMIMSNRNDEVYIAEFKENIDGLCNTGYKIPLSDKITNPNLETVNYYDDYHFLQKYSAELGNLASDFQVKGGCAQGLLTGKVQVSSDGGKFVEVLYYDGKGQVVDIRKLQVGKRLTCIHTDYSYTGKPTRIVTNEYSIINGSKNLIVSQIQENEYSKKTDKLLYSALSVNGKKETIQQFEYDELGRIKSVSRGGNVGIVSYGYNLHGWTTDISIRDFNEELHYTDGVGTPCYNGNISSQLWSTSDYGQIRGYKFEYDGLDRLKEAVYGETSSLSDKQNRYNEKVIEYTANGAMKRFQRRGRKDNGEYGKIDNLNIKLNGNQLLSVTDDALSANKYSSFNFIDGANEQTEYEYNGVGALIRDLNRGMTVSYDSQNNPRRIDFKDGNSITYTYLPDGTLIRKGYGEKKSHSLSNVKDKVPVLDSLTNISGNMDSADSLFMDNLGMLVTGNTEYNGNIIYRNGKLDNVLFSGGYCTFNKNTSEPVFHYFTQDHLGDNRIVTNEDGAVEQITHYYPFGGTFNDAGLNAGLQQYKYNGKELDRIAGLNTYDYGARQYFPSLQMWDRMDPKCEYDYNISPYAYCRNNPVKLIDNDGKRPGDFFLTIDAAAIDFGLFYNDNSIRENREYGTFIYKVTNKSGVTGYSYSFATKGEFSTIEASALPNGHIPTAIIHTHGASTAGKNIEYYDNEFSGIRKGMNGEYIKNKKELKQTSVYDIGYSNKRQITSYLVTPNGSLQKYNPKSGDITTISKGMPSDKHDPKRLNKKSSDIEWNVISGKDYLDINRKLLYEEY